jgi:hypothetical protein
LLCAEKRLVPAVNSRCAQAKAVVDSLNTPSKPPKSSLQGIPLSTPDSANTPYILDSQIALRQADHSLSTTARAYPQPEMCTI